MSIISIINSRAAKEAAVVTLIVALGWTSYGWYQSEMARVEVSALLRKERESYQELKDSQVHYAGKAAHLEFVQARHEDEVAKYKKAAYVAGMEAGKWKEAYVKASSHDLELETLRKEHASMQVENAELRRSYDNAVDEVAALLADKDALTIELEEQEAVSEQLLYDLFSVCEDEHDMRRKADMWQARYMELQHQIGAAAE